MSLLKKTTKKMICNKKSITVIGKQTIQDVDYFMYIIGKFAVTKHSVKRMTIISKVTASSREVS